MPTHDTQVSWLCLHIRHDASRSCLHYINVPSLHGMPQNSCHHAWHHAGSIAAPATKPAAAGKENGAPGGLGNATPLPARPRQGTERAAAALAKCTAACAELAALLGACADCRRHLRACGALPLLAQLLGGVAGRQPFDEAGAPARFEHPPLAPLQGQGRHVVGK